MNKRNIVTVMGLMLCVAAPASASGLLFAPQIERIAPVVKKARPVHQTTSQGSHRSGGVSTRMNTITVAPGLRQIKRPIVPVRKPALTPKAGMRGRVQRPGTQLRPAGHKGMIFSGRRAALRLPPPADLMIIKDPVKIDYRCTDLRKLIVVHEIVRNYGGPLAAYHGKTYVRETQLNGLLLGSPEIPIPPMAHYADVEVAIPVGTTEAYREKLPGRHELRIYIAVNGKVVGHAMLFVEFPKGYCQPKTKSVTQGLTIYRPSLNKLSLGGGVGSGPVTHGKMPDLIPQVSNPFNGIIKVKNQGGATAGASKLTVNCEKIGSGFVASAGDCPSTPALDALPSDASGALLESVPALHAGQVHTIHLPVQGLKWDKGKYRFTYKADATHAVAESNESNNVKTMVRQR